MDKTAKPALMVLLGAGSTANLGVTPLDVPPIGMPSTQAITKRVATMTYPAVVRRGAPILFGPDINQPLQGNTIIPIVPMIYRALSAEFDYVDFELVLHAIEQLEVVIASSKEPRRVDRYRAVLSAFLQLDRRFDLLKDTTLFSAVRTQIVTEIYRSMTDAPVDHFPSAPALHQFIANLKDEFRLRVFTLNYDDIVDGASKSWFDGFTHQVEQSQGGGVWQANAFDARAFMNWRDAAGPLLVHLHGSVRFGYLREGPGTAKYSHSHAALESIENTRVSENYSAGAIVSAWPIISGLSKPAKLAHNPEPFGHYYKAFIDSALECERLLVVGYGGRDDHINVWLDQYANIHGNTRKVAWICKLPGTSVGHMTNEKQVIESLAGQGGFREYLNYDDGNAQKFQQCGALGLVPSGFPVSAEIEAAIIRFLR